MSCFFKTVFSAALVGLIYFLTVECNFYHLGDSAMSDFIKTVRVAGANENYTEVVRIANADEIGNAVMVDALPTASADRIGLIYFLTTDGKYYKCDGTDWTPLATSDAASAASDVSVSSSGFSGNLSAADNTVQKALATLDALDIGSGGGEGGASAASDVSVSSSGFSGNLSAADNTVQKALATLDALDIGSGGGNTSALQDQINDLLDNVMLSAFRQERIGSLTLLKMSGGFADEFLDQSGIDTANSVHQSYSSSGQYYQLPQSATGGTNIFTGGTASADSYYNSSVPPANAFDGDLTNNWEASATSGWWLKYDLGDGITKTPVSLKIKNFSTSGENINSFSFQGSNDNLSWTTLYTGTNPNTSENLETEFTFTNTTAYRYFRVLVNSNHGGTYCLVREIRAYEASESYATGTLISAGQTAAAIPTAARLLLMIENVSASVALNTDIIASVSLDDGTTWQTATLSELDYYEAPKKLYAADVTLTAQGTAKTMRLKLATANSKKVNVHAWALNWR